MNDFPITLGDVTFAGFEIPDVIKAGGEQALMVHKLPGGARVIDSMGADESEIGWSGRFRGALGEARCRRLDTLRKQGQALTLTWSWFRYQVLIRAFHFDHMQPWEIPYQLSLTVLADLTAPVVATPPGFGDVMVQDIQGAGILGSGLSMATVSQALAAVSAAYSAYKLVKSGNPAALGMAVGQLGTSLGAAGGVAGATDALAGLQSSIGGAQSAVQAAIGPINAAVAGATAVGGVTAGLNPLVAANGLMAQASSYGQLSDLQVLDGVLGRMSANTAAQQ